MRWILRAVSVLVVLGLGAAAIVVLVPKEEVARIAARQIEAATGRAVSIAGPVKVRFWPALAVETGPVSIANADWAGTEPMLEAARLRIALGTAALLSGDIRINGLALSEPVLRLERHKDGRANWEIASDPAASSDLTASASTSRGFSIASARLSGGHLVYHDGASGFRQEIVIDEAELQMPDTADAATVALQGAVAGQPVTLSVHASPASGLFDGSGVAARIAMAAGGSRLDFEGRAGHAPPELDGALHLDLADRKALSALIGTPLGDPPSGLGAKRLSLDGRILLTPSQTVSLRDGIVFLDDNRLRFSGSVTGLAAKPRLEAAFSAEGPLVVMAAAVDTAPAVPAGPGSTGWSTAPIDLSLLNAFDGNISFTAPSVALGPVRLGLLRGQMALEDGRAAITLQDLYAYEGRASGRMVVNARGRGSVSADLALSGIALQPLLRDFAGQDRLMATLDGRVSLLSSAASVSEMMHRLQGDGQIALGKGELRGLDLLGMLRTLDPGYVGEGQRTIFDSVTSGFSIADGVLRADDLRFVAPYLRVEGAGVVGIGGRMIDYRLTPVALQNPDGTGGVRVPLRITGPWARPRFGLDVESLVDPKIEAEKARAEARAREAIARKAEEELGVRAEEGESLEDAAKRRVQEEIRKGLGRLFGN